MFWWCHCTTDLEVTTWGGQSWKVKLGVPPHYPSTMMADTTMLRWRSILFFTFLISNIYGVILREVWRLILYSTRENHTRVHQGQCWRKIWFFNHHAVKCLLYRNNASHNLFQQKLFFFAYTCTKCSKTYSI